MPLRMAAERIGSSRGTSKRTPDGWTVTVKLMGLQGQCANREPLIVPVRVQPSLLIVGCGDIGSRVLRLVRGRFKVYALTSSPERRAALRAAGAVPVVGDLDDAA